MVSLLREESGSIMVKLRHIGKAVPRIDARDKVTGKIRYGADYIEKEYLYAKVLRSRYAHALIKNINTEKAHSLPGVEAVLTWKDIPGENRFGIVNPNFPVLCKDKVRYFGDAVAVVAAVDSNTAEKAAGLIEVDYEPLEIVDSIDASLRSDAVKVQDGGNILTSVEIEKGNP